MKRAISRLTHGLSFILSVSFVLFAVFVTGFVQIADEVRENETLGLDREVLTWVQGVFHSPMLDRIIPIWTDVGGTVGILAIGGVILAYLLYRRFYREATLLVAGVGSAVLLSLMLKAVFGRVRPDLWEHLVVETSFSFPSGHAIASSALAFTFIVMLWRTRWRYAAIVSGLAYTLFVGFSRLYLGVHYPTDVVAGWCVSGAWVLLVWAILERTNTTK